MAQRAHLSLDSFTTVPGPESAPLPPSDLDLTLAKTKPPAPAPASPKQATVVDPTPQLEAMTRAVSALSGELKETLVSTTAAAVRSELRGSLVQQLAREVDEKVGAARASLLQRLEEEAQRRAARDSEIASLLEEAHKAVGSAEGRVTALSEEVVRQRIEQALQAATAEAARAVYQREFQKGVDELTDTLDDAEDGYGKLQALIRNYAPGGLPVLQQEIDSSKERIARLERDLETVQGKLQEKVQALHALETERIRERTLHGIDPAEVRRQMEVLDARTQDINERDALQVRVKVLESDLEKARGSLDGFKQREVEVQRNEAERRQLENLRNEVVQLERQLEDADRARHRAEGKGSRASAEVQRLQKELTALESERAAADQRNALLAELTEQLGDMSASHDDARREVASLDRQVNELRVARQTLQRTVDEHADALARAELAWRRAYAEEKREEQAASLDELKAWAEAEAERRAAAHRATAARLETERDALEAERDRLQRALLEAQHAERAALHAQTKAEAELTVQVNATATSKELLQAEHEAMVARIQAQVAAETEAAKARALADIQPEVDRLEAEADHFEAVVKQRQTDRDALLLELARMEGLKGELEAQIESLKATVEELRHKDIPAEERLAQLHRPWFAAEQLPEDAAQTTDEATWLGDLGRRIEQSGFTFHPRLLRAFHTSLKIARDAPLTVLAGISGTGKSELPRLYAELGGVPFMELAVQPSWDSPSDLFGFFNYTDGRLKAEPLAQLLHQANHDAALRKGPVIVLLDEMNLARVEYYFADLLSKLEARRSALRAGTEEARQRASVLLDAGPGQAHIPLFLDPRVHFVGTMNEDESTLTLSDKVLDRACVLTFPAPRDMALRAQTSRAAIQGKRLAWETWQGWKKDDQAGGSEVAEKLNAVNGQMELLGRPFGHRLFRAIHAYIDNYPKGEGVRPDDAWSDQFAMKIMPRLRGLECGDREVGPRLKELRTYVPDDLHEAFDRGCDREFFTWEGAASLYQVEG